MNRTCFLGEDGYMYCDAIFKKGVLVVARSGKWFRFLPSKKKTKRS